MAFLPSFQAKPICLRHLLAWRRVGFMFTALQALMKAQSSLANLALVIIIISPLSNKSFKLKVDLPRLSFMRYLLGFFFVLPHLPDYLFSLL